MKKTIILMMALFVCIQSLYAEDGSSVDTRKEIAIKVVVIGHDTPRPRSLLPILSASLEEGQLWIDFNEPVGDVVISVKKSNEEVVSVYSCDTAYESMVVMCVPTVRGRYTINIVGNQIEAYGEYMYE